jgi:hypothetical protein
MDMDRDAIEKVNRKVSRQFPEMKSVHPSIKAESNASKSKKSFSLTYKGKANLPNGRTISRVVRVVADENGKVLRMSTSK